MAPQTTFTVLCGFASLASAHMKMNTPQPFAVPAVQNGPLAPDGSNFPCQITAGMTASAGGASNVFPLGSTQPLKFTGQATHGGGSCQVSLTYDVAPTKNSVWKVIHSIQGGCPAKNTPGNMGGDASAADPFTYSFPVPNNIPTGNATVAWSWLNKIGNREFYMNCAPVQLTGTSGDKSNYEALPDMLVANLNGINSCVTKEGIDYMYPDPGNSVEDFASDLGYPSGNCGPTVSAGSAPSPAASTPAAGAASSAAPDSAGVFATVPTDGGSAPTAAATVAAAPPPAATPAAAPAPAPAAAPPPAPASAPAPAPAPAAPSAAAGSAAGAQSAGAACSPEGQWVCLGTSYQQCGSGVWTPVMPLAAGTSCTPGQGSSINIVAAGGKARRVGRRFHS